MFNETHATRGDPWELSQSSHRVLYGVARTVGRTPHARSTTDGFYRNGSPPVTHNFCACDSRLSYDACCGPLHSGQAAPTAEALMRSRYSAFVLCNESYLLATWHNSARPNTVAFEPKMKWLGLRIVASKTTTETTAEVEFIARYRIGGGSAARQHERSRFVLEHGRWFYIDGEVK